MRFLPVSAQCFLIELPDLSATLALFQALRREQIDGIAELVPAATTLMVRTKGGVRADAMLAQQIMQCRLQAEVAHEQGQVIEIGVTYNGEDLDDVARFMQLSPHEVIAAHQQALWQVAFCGFAPGFAYMTCDDSRFNLPRRAAPRQKIPAGSVALAGPFCGIYPASSPGGWQLIGTTRTAMWDLARTPPALLPPGQQVRFVQESGAKIYDVPAQLPAVAAPVQGMRIISTAFPILLQDRGRHGQAHQGVSSAGALDLPALCRANRRVGNAPYEAALEITLGPVQLSVDLPVTLALEGAADLAVIVKNGVKSAVDVDLPFALDVGDVLHIMAPRRGMRSYLACRGGYAADRVLGSVSYDTLAQIGPVPLTDGGVIAPAGRRAGAVDPWPRVPALLPSIHEVICLPVTLGPRTDWFSLDEVERFLAQNWRVTAASSRVGIRLEGAALMRDARELPSEGTACGAIQVPHAGQPVLFLNDHPLTGGYPVIATVHPEALPLAGQLPPGSYIRFIADGPFCPIIPIGS